MYNPDHRSWQSNESSSSSVPAQGRGDIAWSSFGLILPCNMSSCLIRESVTNIWPHKQSLQQYLVVYKNTCASIPYLFLIYPMYLCSLYPKFSGAVCKLGEKGPLAVLLWRRTSRVHAMPRKSLILLLDWQPTTPSTLYKWNPAPSLWSRLATTHAQPPSEDGEK